MLTMRDVRFKICDATRTILSTEGIEGLSMRRVAAAVGVTPTAIYRHFADKDELVAAIVDEGFAMLTHYLRPKSKDDRGLLY